MMHIMKMLETERTSLKRRLDGLSTAIVALGGTSGTMMKRRATHRWSAQSRAKLSMTMKKRHKERMAKRSA